MLCNGSFPPGIDRTDKDGTAFSAQPPAVAAYAAGSLKTVFADKGIPRKHFHVLTCRAIIPHIFRFVNGIFSQQNDRIIM